MHHAKQSNMGPPRPNLGAVKPHSETRVTRIGQGWHRHTTDSTASQFRITKDGPGAGPLPTQPGGQLPPLYEIPIKSFPKTGTSIAKLTRAPVHVETGHAVQQTTFRARVTVDQRDSDGTKRYLSNERHAVGGSEDLVGILRPNRKEAEPNATSTPGTYRGYDVEVKKDDGTIEKHRILTHPGYNVSIKARNGEQARVLRLDTKKERALVKGLVEGLQQKSGRNAQLANDLRSSKGVQVTLNLEKGHLTSLDLHQLQSQGHGLFGGLFAR